MTMVDSAATYALWARLKDGSTGLVPVSTMAWEEIQNEIATRISIEFPDAEIRQGWLSEQIELDAPVAVLASDSPSDPMVPVAHGTIWDLSPPDGESGTFSAVAYDPLQSLHSSEVDDWYPSGMSCGALIRAFAEKHGIALGLVDASLDAIEFGAQAIQGKTLATTILDWLKQAWDAGSPRLVTRSSLSDTSDPSVQSSVLDILPVALNETVYWIKSGESALGLERHLSRSKLITRVMVVGQSSNDSASPVIAQLDGDVDRGIAQKILRITQHTSVEDVESAARAIIREFGRPTDDRTLMVVDRPKIRKFDKIRATVGSFDGYAVVEGVIHNADTQTMQIVIGNLIDAPDTGTYTLIDANAIPALSDTSNKVGSKLNGKVSGDSLAKAIDPWLGVPYVFGGSTKSGVDCSGFTQSVFASLGVSLPRTAQAQFNATTRIDTPSVGDLVFFSGTYATTDHITHVGIIVGPDQMVSAIEPRVGRQSLNTAYWRQHFAGYGTVK
jgi:hypothetical protein